VREGDIIPNAHCLYCGNTRVHYFGQSQTLKDVYIPGERTLKHLIFYHGFCRKCENDFWVQLERPE
jgi:hypothetical protein